MHHARPRIAPSATLIVSLTLLAAAGSLWSCASSDKRTSLPAPASVKAMTPIAPPTLADTKPKDLPGVHNLVAYHDGYISGSQPEGDAGFDTLAAMGVKTIISVDGAEPEVEKAKARGIRYIHLPISYG